MVQAFHQDVLNLFEVLYPEKQYLSCLIFITWKPSLNGLRDVASSKTKLGSGNHVNHWVSLGEAEILIWIVTLVVMILGNVKLSASPEEQ